MLDIATAAREILSQNNLRPLYILCGPEYYVKAKYIQILSDYYNGEVYTFDSVQEVKKQFRRKSLLDARSGLYIVRYDEGFISNISEFSLNDISSKTTTTIILFDDEKSYKKCLEKFEDNTVFINLLSPTIRHKHLKEEFPDLPCIKEVISNTSDTMSAYNSCKSLYNTLDENFSKVIYNPKKSYNIQVLIASRQIDKILELSKNVDLDNIIYVSMETMMTLQDLMCNKYKSNDLRKYLSFWDNKSLETFYINCYMVLYNLRKGEIKKSTEVAVLLFSTLCLSTVVRLPL